MSSNHFPSSQTFQNSAIVWEPHPWHEPWWGHFISKPWKSPSSVPSISIRLFTATYNSSYRGSSILCGTYTQVACIHTDIHISKIDTFLKHGNYIIWVGLNWFGGVVPCSASTFIQLRTSCPRWYHAQWPGPSLKKKKIISQENAPQTCPLASLNWRSFFPEDSNF